MPGTVLLRTHTTCVLGSVAVVLTARVAVAVVAVVAVLVCSHQGSLGPATAPRQAGTTLPLLQPRSVVGLTRTS